MAEKWIKTDIHGLRYRYHPTRKRKQGKDGRGVKWERDIFYQYRRTLDGQRIEEGLGWLFDGMTLSKAIAKVHELNENAKLGKGPATLAEAKRIAEQERRAAEEKAAEEARARISFSEVWGKYFPQAQADRGETAIRTEKTLYEKWIKPVIADRALPEIAAIHLEKVKSNMAKAGRAPRSIQYALAVIRQVFNYAKRNDLFTGDNPVGKVKMPKFDNKRTRFLTRDEADRLLKALHEVSTETHDHALMSLRTGMRAGEIWSLQWSDVDIDRGLITICRGMSNPTGTKNSKSRPAFLTEELKAMLRARRPATPNPTALVFPGRGGVKIKQASDTFDRVVDRLGLNAGITDTRQKVTFHTLRHTFASWLVENGTDLYTVKELLGHSDFKMTARYAHLGENTLQAAVKKLDLSLNNPISTDKDTDDATHDVLNLAQTG